MIYKVIVLLAITSKLMNCYVLLNHSFLLKKRIEIFIPRFNLKLLLFSLVETVTINEYLKII
jgi:hypothetical protein